MSEGPSRALGPFKRGGLGGLADVVERGQAPGHVGWGGSGAVASNVFELLGCEEAGGVAGCFVLVRARAEHQDR